MNTLGASDTSMSLASGMQFEMTTSCNSTRICENQPYLYKYEIDKSSLYYINNWVE